MQNLVSKHLDFSWHFKCFETAFQSSLFERHQECNRWFDYCCSTADSCLYCIELEFQQISASAFHQTRLLLLKNFSCLSGALFLIYCYKISLQVLSNFYEPARMQLRYSNFISLGNRIVLLDCINLGHYFECHNDLMHVFQNQNAISVINKISGNYNGSVKKYMCWRHSLAGGRLRGLKSSIFWKADATVSYTSRMNRNILTFKRSFE